MPENMDRDSVLNALETGAKRARWDCDINQEHATIEFIKELSSGDTYQFTIPYSDDPSEDLETTISEALNVEMENALSPDFVEALMEDYDFLDTEYGSAYSFANTISMKIQTFTDCIMEALDEIDISQEASLDEIISDAESKNSSLNMAEPSVDALIKPWYVEAYPTDNLGLCLSDTASFRSVVECLNQKTDVYQELGAGDSLVHERVFKELSDRVGIDYGVVYDARMDEGKIPLKNE